MSSTLAHRRWGASEGTCGHSPLAYSEVGTGWKEERKQEPERVGTQEGELKVEGTYELPLAATAHYHKLVT